jgi:hypothetical protein
VKRILVVIVAVLVIASSALGASPSPKPGARYKGTGKDYMNNAPKWTAEGTGKISFAISTDGTAVIDFKGTYSYYCGAGSDDVTERRISVSKTGSFALEFSQPIKGPNGKVNSTAYVSIAGAFEKGGKDASVSYLVDYVFKGTKVKHPYSTKHPRALGCASWVRGTVKAN